MKLMPALPESVFDIVYLIFAVGTGIRLLKHAGGSRAVRLMGIAALALGGGDAFHLIPRVLGYWVPGEWTAAAGIGKLITSVTMTVFYLLLEAVRRARYRSDKPAMAFFCLLAAVRIGLCLFPQNAWTQTDAPVSWGIYRNIPFVILGILTVAVWMKPSRGEGPFRFLPLAVCLSFLFYIPVVLWTKQMPLIGMLMLPKTVMYIWIICMFRKAARQGPDPADDREA